ncbi:hypothetical protein EI94DRAFT_1340795 [Lactarius quietus]|nr:hypothetical protein EI94DRAFT_1340795 [Lactarius quietus]
MELLNVYGPEWGSVWNALGLLGPIPAISDRSLSSKLGHARLLSCADPYLLVAFSTLTKPLQPNICCILSSNLKDDYKAVLYSILSFSENSKMMIIVRIFPPLRCRLTFPSTSNPTSLCALSSCTFASLFIISLGLSTFTHP